MRRKVYWAIANVAVALVLACQVVAFATCADTTCGDITQQCGSFAGCKLGQGFQQNPCCCTVSVDCCQYECWRWNCTPDPNSTTTCTRSTIINRTSGTKKLNSTCNDPPGTCSSRPSTTSTLTARPIIGMNVLSFGEG